MTLKSKIINTAGIAGIVLGTGLCIKSCTDDGKYEDFMIESQRENEIYENHNGHFYDTQNAYGLLAGLGLICTGLYALSYKKKE